MSESDYFQQSAKEPPHSIQAEQSVLGGLMIDNSAWGIISELLTANSFYHKDHQFMFLAIEKLAKEQSPFDVVTFSEILKESGEYHAKGWLIYCAELCRNTPSAANIKTYAEIVRDRFISRQMISIYQNAIDKAFEPKGDPIKSVLSETIQKSSEMMGNFEGNTGGLKPIKPIIANLVDNLEIRFENENNLPGLETGFIDFDKKTGGLQDSDLVIIGGRPSMGKSTVLQNMVENYVVKNQNSPVAIFSIEMPAEIFVMRMIASLGRIELSKMISGKLQDDDWARLTSAINLLANSKIYIDESSYLPVQTYLSRLEKFETEHGEIGLIGIDYLQLMDAPEHKNNPVQRIGAISRGLKMSAKKHKCPVIALSQLSRNVESRTDKRPMMSDLRESGAIEQDADLIVFVYRDEVYNEDSQDKGVAEFIIAKSRNGEIGTVRATSNLAYARFENHASARYED